MLLNIAMEKHDQALAQRGQYGILHRCNSQPFQGKMMTSEFHSIEGGNAPSIFNFTNLWYYNATKPISGTIEFGTTESMIVDKLCRGGKVKVIIHSINNLIRFLYK